MSEKRERPEEGLAPTEKEEVLTKLSCDDLVIDVFVKYVIVPGKGINTVFGAEIYAVVNGKIVPLDTLSDFLTSWKRSGSHLTDEDIKLVSGIMNEAYNAYKNLCFVYSLTTKPLRVGSKEVTAEVQIRGGGNTSNIIIKVNGGVASVMPISFNVLSIPPSEFAHKIKEIGRTFETREDLEKTAERLTNEIKSLLPRF